jgi:hypothetical protein
VRVDLITWLQQAPWLLLLTLAAGVLAVIDGIVRVRARGGVLAVLEIVAGALVVLSLFFPLEQTISVGRATLALILLVVLVLVLAFRRGRGPAPVLAVIAVILAALVTLVGYGWLTIPGIA